MSFNFMAAVTICSEFGAQKIKSVTVSTLSLHDALPILCTEKTILLTRRTFAGKVMSLLFNMLSRLVIAFLPRSNCLLISWLQSPSAVIWSPPK